MIAAAMSERLKGLLAFSASVGCWLLDKAFGDALFSWLRSALGLPEQAPLVRFALEWGPALLFAALGLFLFVRAGHYTSHAKGGLGLSSNAEGIGGEGGRATVGGNGLAIGGPGGQAGDFGTGGKGGSAEVRGDGISVGGAGGHAGRHGVWSPPAMSGYEVMRRSQGLPVDPALRQFGRGGVSPEYYNKLAIVAEIKNFLLKRVSDPEDTTEIPISFINDELERRHLDWRVRIIDHQFEFFSLE